MGCTVSSQKVFVQDSAFQRTPEGFSYFLPCKTFTASESLAILVKPHCALLNTQVYFRAQYFPEYWGFYCFCRVSYSGIRYIKIELDQALITVYCQGSRVIKLYFPADNRKQIKMAASLLLLKGSEIIFDEAKLDFLGQRRFFHMAQVYELMGFEWPIYVIFSEFLVQSARDDPIDLQVVKDKILRKVVLDLIGGYERKFGQIRAHLDRYYIQYDPRNVGEILTCFRMLLREFGLKVNPKTGDLEAIVNRGPKAWWKWIVEPIVLLGQILFGL